ncbi:hypothetical protein Smp_126230 [Schistosoma mansoni]|uniref:hypothetical protein n=1 Tax=Schistosoma mansoni TaxID=6183 RepID=UPI0001A63E1C|nr:hypothetical protein Smp_126230 [Schistosoma mansoni]|eukprot:XP_018646837.1 hypothetical protein Smp_126230 [Schistosoma mansoni]
MNKRSLTTITPLLCITIHIENYIELQINDEYNLPILQYHDNDYKSILQIYPNVHNNDFYHDKRIIETIPSTSNHFKSNNEYQKRRTRKEKEGLRKLKNKHCQTDLIYIDENNIKSWEVDIKHVSLRLKWLHFLAQDESCCSIFSEAIR